MKVLRKLAIPAAVATLLFMANISPEEPSRYLLGIQLISDANAIFGVRRRTRRRSLFFGYEAGRASAEAQDDNGGSKKSSDDNGGSSSDSSSSDSSSSDSSSSDSSSSGDSSSDSSKSKKTTDSKGATTASASQSKKSDKALPLGVVVTALPSGCATTTSGDIEYYHCGPNYYRAVFQGNSLVYVTAKP